MEFQRIVVVFWDANLLFWFALLALISIISSWRRKLFLVGAAKAHCTNWPEPNDWQTNLETSWGTQWSMKPIKSKFGFSGIGEDRNRAKRGVIWKSEQAVATTAHNTKAENNVLAWYQQNKTSKWKHENRILLLAGFLLEALFLWLLLAYKIFIFILTANTQSKWHLNAMLACFSIDGKCIMKGFSQRISWSGYKQAEQIIKIKRNLLFVFFSITTNITQYITLGF